MASTTDLQRLFYINALGLTEEEGASLSVSDLEALYAASPGTIGSVKSVDGLSPDENGNIDLNLPDAEAIAALQSALDDYEAGQDASDTAVASAIATGTETQGPLTAAILGRTALPVAYDVTLTAETTGTVRPIEAYDGEFWGCDSTGQLHTSTDGTNWSAVGTPAPAMLKGFIPNAAGELVGIASDTCYKTSGWATDPATATWATVTTASVGSATFNRHTFDGYGDKFILTEYSSVSRTDSKWAQISLDGGETWAVVWDTTVQFPTTHSQSHLHTACYDRWADRFFIAEGHGDPTGIYWSDDDGSTWTRMTGGLADSLEPTPTVMTATDDGIVCGTDAPTWAVFGIPRTADPNDMALVGLYRWDDDRNGVLGFGMRGWRDPATGIVTIPYRSASPGGVDGFPIIASGTATRAGLTWTAPDGGDSAGVYGAYIIGGTLAVSTFIDDTTWKVGTGKVAPTVIASNADNTGNMRGGTTNGNNSSLAVGYGANTDGNNRHTAVGVGATAYGMNGDGVAVGWNASSNHDNIAIGAEADASGPAQSVAIGLRATASGSQAFALGYNTQSTGNGTVIIGANGSATASGGIAIGSTAQVGGPGGVALGFDAQVPAGFTNAVALGRFTVATWNNQVAFGPRHFEIGASTAFVPAPAAGSDKVRLWLADNGSGKLALYVRFPTGGSQILATEP